VRRAQRRIDIDNKASTGPLGPGVSFQQGTRFDLSAEDTQDITERTKILLLFGVITYLDIFGQKRYTRWCFRYEPVEQDFANAATDNDFT
jgi:hypothetical protein